MDKLHEAIQEWYEASAEYDREFYCYDGYSWGWVGREYIDRRQNAAENIEKTLNDLIDSRVSIKIEKLIKVKQDD